MADEFEEQLKQEELAKQTEEGGSYDYSRYYQDTDGTYYEYDYNLKAWMPMITDDFIAQYNLNYGVHDQSTPATVEGTASLPPTSAPSDAHASTSTGEGVCGSEHPKSEAHQEESKTDESQDKSKRKRAPPPPPAWFDIDDQKNTNVYVTGLPTDITEQEYLELMNKVGLVASDPISRKLKLKLYKNPDGTYKGDGRCCYLKPESVELALSILDGSDVKGNIISVERAKFEMKGQYDPSKKRRKLTKQEKKKAEEKEKWLLGWEPEKKAEGRPRWEKTVVIKNAFTPKQIEESPSMLLELTDDFRDECRNYGDVKKVQVCDRHEEGVVLVTFKTPEEADACIAAVNGRWFGGLMLSASTYDGRTKYYVQETEEERAARMKKWSDFLQSGGDGQPGTSEQPSCVRYDTKQDSERNDSLEQCNTETSGADSGADSSSIV